jgi:hypothetical protein
VNARERPWSKSFAGLILINCGGIVVLGVFGNWFYIGV